MVLTAHPGTGTSLEGAVWIDLVNATEDERKRVETVIKQTLPTQADIQEIETSSRVYVESSVLYLSTPLLTGDQCVTDTVTSVGFVLTPSLLVTQRFAAIQAFEAVARRYDKVEKPTASDAFLKLLEVVVDHAADALEHAGTQLETISHRAFRGEPATRRKHTQTANALRDALRRLGSLADGISHLRDSLLGISRIAAFVDETARETHLSGLHPRLKAIRGDISSLNDYQAHLSAKIQFLLDATLGFISIQQNEIVKTLTIVSVVGVPPVLIAGIYGMNFKFMPELTWHLGYPFALALILLSGLLPLGWLKWRGWM
jgi:magnesium transporter